MIRNEDDLFNYLKQKYFSDLRHSKDKYAFWDCISEKHKAIIELKSRSAHYETIFIEKQKYNALKDLAKEAKKTPLFIVSTPKGVYAFNLNKTFLNWQEMDVPSSTHFNHLKKKVIKEMGFLDVSKAKII